MDRSLYTNSQKLFISLQIGPGIWAVFLGESIAVGEVNKVPGSSTWINPALLMGGLPGLV